jgi:predicted nucleic acid-binding protein
VTPYFLSYAILEHYAALRRQLRPPYGPGLIGAVDTLLAATALQRNLALVTYDSDFQRAPGLNVLLLARSGSV